MATLFSYFTKTPKQKKPYAPVCENITEGKKNNSPQENAQLFNPIKDGKQPLRTLQLGAASPLCSQQSMKLECLAIVLAKLDGHPWWPSIICKHPTQSVHLRAKKCHVQFFGDPPSRAWVSVR